MFLSGTTSNKKKNKRPNPVLDLFAKKKSKETVSDCKFVFRILIENVRVCNCFCIFLSLIIQAQAGTSSEIVDVNSIPNSSQPNDGNEREQENVSETISDQSIPKQKSNETAFENCKFRFEM